jgi:uncharacterized protein YjgD (DUF1641 family)
MWLDILVQRRHDKKVAKKFFRKLLKDLNSMELQDNNRRGLTLGRADMERRFLGLIRTCNGTGDEIHQEVGHTAVTPVVNLRDVLELVVDRFN